MKRRVVITGLGAVTPLGVGARPLHERWASGICGIVDGAGACRDFDPAEFLSLKEARRLDRFSQFALVAAGEALAHAGWEQQLPYDPLRVGCVIATGIGGQRTVEAQLDVLREKGPKMVSPLASISAPTKADVVSRVWSSPRLTTQRAKHCPFSARSSWPTKRLILGSRLYCSTGFTIR